MGYPCANFSLPGPLCSRLRPDVRDRRTSGKRVAECPPTNLALFRHKITLYRFNQGGRLILLQVAQMGAGGLSPPPTPSHFNHCLSRSKAWSGERLSAGSSAWYVARGQRRIYIHIFGFSITYSMNRCDGD